MQRCTGFWRQVTLLAVLLLPLGAIAATTVATVPKPIVIGQAIDLSGPNASIGRDYVAGIKTCFDALNASGGIGGRHIQYIVRDDRGEPQMAAKLVAALIEREQIDYLFGGVGDDVLQAVIADTTFKRSGLTLFAPMASGGTATAAAPVLFWRPSYQQEIQHVFAHFARLGVKDIGVVVQPSTSSQEAYRSLVAEIHARKMTLTATMSVSTSPAQSERQLAAEARRMAASRPDFVVVLADTISTALFLKEFRRYSAQTFVAGTSLTNLATLRELAGATAVEWTVFAQVVPNPNAGTSMLQTEHLTAMRKYRDESVSAMTLEGYAAAKSLAMMLQAARPEHGAFQQWLAQKKKLDLGGLTIAGGSGNHLSSYLDIALFRKGGSLVF